MAVLEEDDPYQPPADDAYAFLPDGLSRIAANPYGEISRLRAGNRLSLAGGQEKIALYHDARAGIDAGWYVQMRHARTQRGAPVAPLAVSVLDRLAYALAHGLVALDVDYIGPVNYAINDRIGYRAFAQLRMPSGRRELGADEQRARS